jgi:hypothetical protein
MVRAEGGQLTCNHYRQAILKGETIAGWSIDQFSEIKVECRPPHQKATFAPLKLHRFRWREDPPGRLRQVSLWR